MLRVTLSKLKKVCLESFTSKVFRGDFYLRTTTGKFQKFSAPTLSRNKSTNSGKGSKDDDEKCQKLIDEIFNTKITEDPSVDLSNIQEVKREQIDQIVSPVITTPGEQCKQCEKLIAEAFGKDGDDNKLTNDVVVSATAAKQTEEHLAQKIETIDETPVVEAAKPKIEGFNIKPKVLGAEENVRLETLNFKSEGKDRVPVTVITEKTNKDLEEMCQKIERSNMFYYAGKNLYKMPDFTPLENCNSKDPTHTGKTNVNHPYDDIAKRCVNTPQNKIDRQILRELERLGVPNSGGYGSNCNNVGNVDDLNKQMNNFNPQRGNFGGAPPDNQFLNLPYEKEQLKVERPIVHRLDKRPMPLCMMEQNVIDDTIMTLATVGPKPQYNPNRMLLDPFDKKSLCYDCVDPEYEVVTYDKVHVLVQRLENKNYDGHNTEAQDKYLQTNDITYAKQTHYTQSAEQTQSHIKPEWRGYEIKPIHESPRLPEIPVNYCNENYTIHPANREQHYSMEPFKKGETLHNQMNYQENMVPNQTTSQKYQHEQQHHQPEHVNQNNQNQVNTPMNYQNQEAQNQQQNFWNTGYQNQTNYYENRFQGYEQHHQITPEESTPEQQSYMQTPAVHVFTNVTTEKLETPKTVQTVLPRTQNVTAEEVAEDIKQQTSKQAGEGSDEHTKTAEESTNKQFNFYEQSPARQEQFHPPTEQSHQEQLGKPINPMHMSVNDYVDQLDLRQPIETTEALDTSRANQEQINIKEQKQSVKADSEQLLMKEQPILQAQTLHSTKGRHEQLDLKERKQSTEQLKVLESVKANPEQLTKKEQPIKQADTLEPVKAHSEKHAKKEKAIEQAQILKSAKTSQEQLVKEQKHPIEQLKVLESVKTAPESLYKKERPIQHARVLDSVQAEEKQAKTLGAKVFDSVKAHQEELAKEERPIEHAKLLSSDDVQQERLHLKKLAIDQLKIVETAKAYQEKLKKKRPVEHDKVLASVKPQEQEKPTEPAEVLASVEIQEGLEKKTEPKSEDPNDEFKKKLSSTILPLPKLNTNEKLPLSVLLKRLRERSKIESCHGLINPVGKKCGCPDPPCPPPAPTCPPPKPCPPPPCPPPPPPCPKPCKPSCPSPCGPPKPPCPPKNPPCCSNYIQVDTEFDFAAILRETDIYLKKRMYETVTAILTKDVIMQLEKMGVSLLITYPNEEINLKEIEELRLEEVTAENNIQNLEDSQVNSNSVDLARDYEPWVPIPSWPIPRKEKKRPLVCPKDGCKILPPPKLNPPCKQNPCIGFPKRSNSFSTPDTSDLSENMSVR